MQNRKSGKSRSKFAMTNKTYSDVQKIEAVTAYLMLGGNIGLTSHTTHIPHATLYEWTKSEWWNTLVSEVRKEEKLQLSSRLKKIVEAGWTVAEDRLERGDWILNNKTGEIMRKPVSLRDASKVAVDAANLRQNLDLGEGFITQADAIEDKLAKLALAFTNLSKGITNNQSVEEIGILSETTFQHGNIKDE
jgi:hypothetical protein